MVCGYVGFEIGPMYRPLGSRVTIIEHHKQLLPNEDDDIAAEVLKLLQEEEIAVTTNAEVLKIQKENGSINAHVTIGGKDKIIQCSHILVSAGRTPNTKDLNLGATGVEVNDQDEVIVNEKLETTAKDIYAVGDVKGGTEFTHIAYNDYIIV